MVHGVRVGKSIVSKRGQGSLSITIPKQIVENLGVQKGDVFEFYQSPDFGENVVLLVLKKNDG